MQHYREILKNDFEPRLKVNPRYSMRSYAKTLGIAVSRLSCILSAKQGISEKTALKIVDKIPLNPTEKDFFLATALSEDKRSQRNRTEGLKRLKDLKSYKQVEVDDDVFSVVSDWYHFALLELIQTKNCQHQVSWLAERLNISQFQVKQALSRLIRLGLIGEDQGAFKFTGTSLTTQQDVPSADVRKFNLQVLQLAQNAVVEQTVEERDFSTLTVGLDSRLLPQFKDLIGRFRSEFNELAESIPEDQRDEVFILATNLFKLTK